MIRRLGWGIALAAAMTLSGLSANGQTLLHHGGELDFEAGFTVYTPSIFDEIGRPWDEVGNGWAYWGQRALFQPPQDRHGAPAFNRNQFAFNVSNGYYSQEITMTSANGDAIIWYTVDVPLGATISCLFDTITTPSADNLQVRHAIGLGEPLDFFGMNVTNPFDVPLDWEDWDINDTNNHFATYAVTVHDVTSTQLTYYFWVRHFWATQSGATLVCDNLRVFEGEVVPTPTPTFTHRPTRTPTPTRTPLPVDRSAIGVH